MTERKDHSFMFMRTCSRCRMRKEIFGGYVRPKLFICAECRRPPTKEAA